MGHQKNMSFFEQERQGDHSTSQEWAAGQQKGLQAGAEGQEPHLPASIQANIAPQSDPVEQGKRKEVEQQLASLMETANRLRAYRRQMWVTRVGWIVFIVLLCWLTHFKVLQFWWIYAMGGGSAAMTERALGRLREQVHAVIKMGEPCTVGALALMIHERDMFVRQAADRALRRLLPQVKASDANYITSQQMDALIMLAATGDPEMQVLVLRAFEQIGDERALPVVEQLMLSDFSEVQEAARACLPYLQVKARQAIERATLLRGTFAPISPSSPQELLRPTTSQPNSAVPEQLLRPTDSEETEGP